MPHHDTHGCGPCRRRAMCARSSRYKLTGCEQQRCAHHRGVLRDDRRLLDRHRLPGRGVWSLCATQHRRLGETPSGVDVQDGAMKSKRTMGAFAFSCLLLLTHCGSPQAQRASSNARTEGPRSTNATQAPLPETPGRAEIMNAMLALRPNVEACNAGPGQARVVFVFDGPTGNLISASVVGSLAGTPIGACIEDAVRGARLSPFRRATFDVDFPFRL